MDSREDSQLVAPSVNHKMPYTSSNLEEGLSENICTKSNTPLIIVLLLSLFSSMLLNSIMAPFFPREAQEKFNMSTLLIGAIFAVYPAVIFLFSPLAIWMGGKIGQFATLSIGISILGTSTIFFGLSNSIRSFFITRFLQGIGTAFVDASSLSLSVVNFPHNFGTFMRMGEVVAGLGFMIGPPLGAYLYNVGGFQVPFIVTGTISLFVLLPLFFLVFLHGKPNKKSLQILGPRRSRYVSGESEPRTERDSSITSGRRSIWSKSYASFQQVNVLEIMSFPMLVASLVVFLSAVSLSFFVPTFTQHLHNILKLNVQVTSYVFMVMPVLSGLSLPFIRWISDDIGGLPIIAIGFVLMILSYLFIGPSPILSDIIEHNTLTLCLCILIGSVYMGFGAGMMFIPSLPLMNKIGSAQYGADSTDAIAVLFSSMYSFGDVVGPLLGGALDNYFGFEWACTIWATILLISTSLLLIYCLLYRI